MPEQVTSAAAGRNATGSGRKSRRTQVSAAVAAGLALALSVGPVVTASAAEATLSACLDNPPTPAGGQPPVAQTIKPSNTSTSTVITPTDEQIQCGRTELTTYNNVVYSTPTTASGTETQLMADIQVPATSGKKPLVIYLTGGGFMASNRTENLSQRTYVAEQGYVVASISYRTVLNGGATYEQGVEDVKAAIRYLRAHADEYGIDTSQVAVWGQSAGGYLAAMTGVTNGLKKFEEGDHLDQSSSVQAVIDEFGPANLSTTGSDYDQATYEANIAPGNNLAQYVYGAGTTKSVATYTSKVAAADPATYASKNSPAFALFHGSADQLVSPSQTLKLSDKLKAKGADATRYVVEGANHGDMAFMGNTESVKDWSSVPVMNAITGFLDEKLD
ncbi:alpha/beta hydrolase [Streptomyces sp. NPDC093252]|uniref:alpha/beta hydrolase n=1 Tax=Streptomyces sp. NPDC093252 TaxID=3154980 RepID=UPI003441358F